MCQVERWDRPHKARGYCSAHYKRVLATGDPRADDPILEASGQGRIHQGYEYVATRLDSRLENLGIWSNSHPSGARVEDLVEFAVIILARYAARGIPWHVGRRALEAA